MAQDEDRDARVGDYLDDKLQTLADLDSLDALLSNVRHQQTLLKKQLEDAETDFAEARKFAHEHDAVVEKQRELFDKEQADIDRRLKIITRSDTSDDAVRQFEASMDRLRRVNVANGYVQMLKDADDLSRECEYQLGKDDGAALNAYSRLHSLASNLGPLQEAAEGAAPHLLDHIQGKADSARKSIEKAFITEMNSILKKVNWPSTDTTIPDTLYDEFGTAFSKLLDLQMPELEEFESLPEHIKSRQSPVVLLPMKALVKPLELGFRYHFEGDKPTNKLDHPEYFLSHITDRLLGQYSDFVLDNVQPILAQHFKGSNLGLNPACVDATSVFITALLPMVRNKVYSILPQAFQQPQIFSHLIHELMSFDTKLREEWQYTAGSTMHIWRGLTWDVLSSDDWFAKWLEVEKEFALSRYEEIVETPDAFSIDFDSVSSSRTKPTKAAIRVNDLIETTTDHYRPLTSFSQKLRFLIDIQTTIFDRFHERMADNLRMYVARTSTLTRTSKEEQLALQGLPGLETLCRTYGSAEYLEQSMRDWSDDVFFLELWSELQYRITANQAGRPVAGDLTIAEIAEKTSATVGSSDAEGSGSIFDEAASTYTRLRKRCEDLIVELLQNNITKTLSAYAKINPWATLAAISGQPSPSAELDPLVSSLSTLLAFLSRALSPLSLRRIARQAVQTLDTYLFDRVLLTHSFSAAGTAQLVADLGAIRSVLDRYVGGGVAETGLARSVEAAKLLSVPVKGSIGAEGDEEGGSGSGTRKWGLWEVEKLLIKSDGEVAKDFLAEFGLERLSVGEARRILARKVELGS